MLRVFEIRIYSIYGLKYQSDYLVLAVEIYIYKNYPKQERIYIGQTDIKAYYQTNKTNKEVIIKYSV